MTFYTSLLDRVVEFEDEQGEYGTGIIRAAWPNVGHLQCAIEMSVTRRLVIVDVVMTPSFRMVETL